MAYDDDVNLIVDDIRTIERNVEMILNTCKDIGLVVNTGRIAYMGVGRY